MSSQVRSRRSVRHEAVVELAHLLLASTGAVVLVADDADLCTARTDPSSSVPPVSDAPGCAGEGMMCR